jgi:WD40 repeat protein
MRLRTLAFSPNSDRLATAGEDRKVHVWDTATGQEIVALGGGDSKVMSLCFCAADRLASGGSDNLVHIWDLSTGKETTHFSGHLGTVAALACDPAGKLLVSGGFDASVRVWQLEGPGQAMRPIEEVQSR